MFRVWDEVELPPLLQEDYDEIIERNQNYVGMR